MKNILGGGSKRLYASRINSKEFTLAKRVICHRQVNITFFYFGQRRRTIIRKTIVCENCLSAKTPEMLYIRIHVSPRIIDLFSHWTWNGVERNGNRLGWLLTFFSILCGYLSPSMVNWFDVHDIYMQFFSIIVLLFFSINYWIALNLLRFVFKRFWSFSEFFSLEAFWLSLWCWSMSFVFTWKKLRKITNLPFFFGFAIKHNGCSHTQD